MSDVSDIVVDTATRLFADIATAQALDAAEGGAGPGSAWTLIEDSGLDQAMVPEDLGGPGLALSEAAGLLRLAGAHALPLPLGETMVARWLAAIAGLDCPAGPLSFAHGTDLALNDDCLSGRVARVPWARHAATLLLLAGDRLCMVSRDGYTVEAGANLALEPRDTISLDQAPVTHAPSPVTAEGLQAIGAALRAITMAGAMRTVLEMTVSYANERVQFGKPIGKFQAIQQNIAVLAGQAAAAGGAADLAAAAIGLVPDTIAIAAAKIRAGEAAGIAAAITHQVHGAIGFTQEHRLHYFTKRLWSWRDEFGDETRWSDWLGTQALAAEADGYWHFLTQERTAS